LMSEKRISGTLKRNGKSRNRFSGFLKQDF